MAQGQLFDPGSLNPHQFEPVHSVVEGAKSFTHGHFSTEGLGDVAADRFKGLGIARAYRAALDAPEAPGIRRSYDVFRKHVNKQYEHMTKPVEEGGMGIKHELVHSGDPYGGIRDTADDVAESAKRMGEDVRQGRIKTLSTAATGSHAFLSDEENDRFRAVHDVFGHAATGRGFDAHGEVSAYLSHRQMFPSAAHPALQSETEGQNSYLNYGPGGLRSGSEVSFPDQGSKLIGLPKGSTRVRRKR